MSDIPPKAVIEPLNVGQLSRLCEASSLRLWLRFYDVGSTALPRVETSQQTMLALLVDAGSTGLKMEEWNTKAREAGVGVRRKATLTDIRLALKTKKLVYEFDGVWKLSFKG